MLLLSSSLLLLVEDEHFKDNILWKYVVPLLALPIINIGGFNLTFKNCGNRILSKFKQIIFTNDIIVNVINKSNCIKKDDISKWYINLFSVNLKHLHHDGKSNGVCIPSTYDIMKDNIIITMVHVIEKIDNVQLYMIDCSLLFY